MKSLHDGLIAALEEEDSLQAAIPEGYYAIKGSRGYILCPDELSIDEWIENQDKHPYEPPESNSGVQKAHKCPIGRNVAKNVATNSNQVAVDITEGAPTEASLRADSEAFDKLFPELNED